MVTNARYRSLVLGLPQVEEKSHMGHPDFRVNNKIFATLWPDRRRAVLKLDRDTQSALLLAEPSVFSTPGKWGRSGWTNVDLKTVDARQLPSLVQAAWRLTAPKRLVASHEGTADADAATSPSRIRRRPRT